MKMEGRSLRSHLGGKTNDEQSNHNQQFHPHTDYNVSDRKGLSSGVEIVSSVLFAAGVGKRLRPLTERVAKPALPVLDVPLGTWGLAALARSAPPVIVNASHLAGTIETALRAALPGATWELFVEEPEGFGTAGTLRALRDRFDGPVVTHNGDLLCDLDPAAVLRSHVEGGAMATAAFRPVDANADAELSADRVVEWFDRRRTSKPGWQFVGIAVFDAAALGLLPDLRPAGLGESLLTVLAERGELAAHRFHGYALDVGTPSRYLQANIDVLNEIAPAPPVRPPGIALEVTGGRAYVGLDAVVSHESLGPNAIVLSGARIATDAHVENAIVWPNESVGAGITVRDAIWAFGGPVDAAI
jgi:mannose-1-phosphate guanylyltransferase